MHAGFVYCVGMTIEVVNFFNEAFIVTEKIETAGWKGAATVLEKAEDE